MLCFIQPSIMFKDRLPMLKAYPNLCLTQSLLKAFLQLTSASKRQAVPSWILVPCLLMGHARSVRVLGRSPRRCGQGFSSRVSAEANQLTVHRWQWLSQAVKYFTAVGRGYLKTNYCHSGMEWLSISFGTRLWQQVVRVAPKEDWSLTSTWK